MADQSEMKQRIRTDLTAAMKAKDAATTATLRMLLAAVGAEEVSSADRRELDDQQVTTVLLREKKKRGESATVFADNGRPELAEKERSEAAIIDRYLPTQLDDAGIDDVARRAVAQVADETGEQPGMRQMGQVMKIATSLAAGGADGKRLSSAVRAQLS